MPRSVPNIFHFNDSYIPSIIILLCIFVLSIYSYWFLVSCGVKCECEKKSVKKNCNKKHCKLIFGLGTWKTPMRTMQQTQPGSLMSWTGGEAPAVPLIW